jgi:hypothetical protein
VEQVLPGELISVEEGKRCGKYCAHMNVNRKKQSVETIPGMEKRGDKGEWWSGEGEFKYDIFDIL